MSQETTQWLNTNTLIGFTDKRGHAWHFSADDQGDEPNHYPLAVPVEDVRRRLFHWEAVEGNVQSTVLLPDGVLTITDPERKTIIRPDTQQILGIFKSGYRIHQFDEWLLEQVEGLLDDDLGVGSAGLLKGGAVAFVSIEIPDSITTPEGVEFRPNLLAVTSHDGSLSTTYQRVVTNVVCDNTMSAALSEAGQRIKVKHSKYSKVKLTDAREALAIVHTISEDFAAEVAALTAIKVPEADWRRFLDALAPVPEEDGRSKTMATNKRNVLTKLWNTDLRVAPWKNTAWGVVQAINTATHHEFTVHGDRSERNALRAASGGVDKLDGDTKKLLASVLA